MVITKISADGFKNLKKVEIYPHEKMNIFCGKNDVSPPEIVL